MSVYATYSAVCDACNVEYDFTVVREVGSQSGAVRELRALAGQAGWRVHVVGDPEYPAVPHTVRDHCSGCAT